MPHEDPDFETRVAIIVGEMEALGIANITIVQDSVVIELAKPEPS